MKCLFYFQMLFWNEYEQLWPMKQFLMDFVCWLHVKFRWILSSDNEQSLESDYENGLGQIKYDVQNTARKSFKTNFRLIFHS